MKTKGFTLIETLVGLFIIGIISVTILPIINISLLRLANMSIRMDMIYKSESIIEAIKAYNIESSEETFVCGESVSHIVNYLNSDENVEMEFLSKDDGEKYKVYIVKTKKSNNLWNINLYMDENKVGSKTCHVEYKALLPYQ